MHYYLINGKYVSAEEHMKKENKIREEYLKVLQEYLRNLEELIIMIPKVNKTNLKKIKKLFSE